MNIGVALKYYRKLSNMTQIEVAENADVNEKYYGELERNESSPTVDRLEMISGALGVSIQQIVAYKPLESVVIDLVEYVAPEKSITAYCNCCGTEFCCEINEVVCPQCGCEYSEENEYIEVY